MAHKHDKIVADIQLIVGPSVPVNLSSVEIDYIEGLEGPYQEVAVYRAAKGQFDRLGKAEESRILAQTIAGLEIELVNREVQEYNSNRAWVDNYGNFQQKQLKQLELEKIIANTLIQQQALQLQQVEATQQQVAQNNQFLSGTLGDLGTGQSTTSIAVPPKPPKPTIKLPEVVGRKFRGVPK